MATLHQFEQSAMRRLRAKLLRRGQDVTERAAQRSCLVIAPHPDDETLGCGATIMRKVAAGKAVHVAIVTDGRASHKSVLVPPKDLAQIRHTEAVRACELMGVPRERVVFLDVQDGHVQHAGKDLAVWLEEILISTAPDELLAPSPIDKNPDHRAIAAVVRRLLAMGVIRCPVLEYPVWFWTFRAWMEPGQTQPMRALRLMTTPGWAASGLSPVLVRTDGFLDRKREALACHKSQTTNMTGEASWATLEPAFLENFFQSHEMFFELAAAASLARAG